MPASTDGLNKICSMCKISKSIDSFANDKNRKDNKYPICKECRHKPKLIVNQVDHKKCIRCGINKNIDEYFRSKHTSDGYKNVCKMCDTKIPPKYLEVVEKKCTKCLELKPISMFNQDKRSPNKHKSICKECLENHKRGYNKRLQIYNTDEMIKKMDEENPNKVCINCKNSKLKSEFDIRRSAIDGHSSYCRDCHKSEHKEKFESHKEMDDDQYKQWRIIENKKRKEETLRVKKEVFSHYCPNGIVKCANPYGVHSCDITDLDALTLDHIYGDGYLEKDEKGMRSGGISYYRKIKQQGYPNRFQILCGACQLKKAVVNKEHRNGKKMFAKKQF